MLAGFGIADLAMQRATLLTLSMRELDRLRVPEAVVDTGLQPGRAAEQLGLTIRRDPAIDLAGSALNALTATLQSIGICR
jgi:hypothetical protein